MSFPNPLAVLKQAIIAVPSVKWALGVAGIISVVAIVYSGWKVDPTVAVFGCIVMLILMTMLVIFARLSTTSGPVFRQPVLVFTWSSLLLTIAAAVLLFTSVFFQWPLNFSASGEYTASPDDQKVWDLEEQVNALRGTWESMLEYQYNDTQKAEILERATKLGQALQSVDDRKLGPSGHVIKREFACYAFIIAASVESYPSKMAQVASEADSLCKQASDDLNYLAANSNKNRNTRYTAAWAQREDQRPFVDYLSSMASCLVGLSSNDNQKAIEAVREVESKVPSYYLAKYPPDRDSILSRCVQRQ